MTPTILFILFALIAFVLFVAEVFVPGGIIGALGVVSLLTACGFAFSAFGTSTGLVVSLLLILATIGGFMVWLMKMPDTRIGKRFSLQSGLTTAKSAPDQPDLVGKTGVAETDLRPSGFARVEGQRLDVVAARGYVKKGTSITITEVHGSRIVVRIAVTEPS
jgi:membrane-bound serine protease (ClpP class)